VTTKRVKRRRQGRTPVNAAVLALVIEKPSYGYEVWQRFEERFRGVLEVGSSRIYQAVDGLLDDGLIEELPGAAAAGRRQPRPCYRATARGAQAHREWLAEELRGDPTRIELNRRLLATGAHDALALADVIDRYERACLDEMAQLRTVVRDAAPTLRDRLLAEERRLVLEARLKWILFARGQLRAGPTASRPPAAEPS
jgi:DNA-binding PadR family transcriptional regulator